MAQLYLVSKNLYKFEYKSLAYYAYKLTKNSDKKDSHFGTPYRVA